MWTNCEISARNGATQKELKFYFHKKCHQRHCNISTKVLQSFFWSDVNDYVPLYVEFLSVIMKRRQQTLMFMNNWMIIIFFLSFVNSIWRLPKIGVPNLWLCVYWVFVPVWLQNIIRLILHRDVPRLACLFKSRAKNEYTWTMIWN